MTNLTEDEKWIKNFKALIKSYEEENTKLKELLKIFREYLKMDTKVYIDKSIILEIDQVLQENKDDIVKTNS